LLNVSLLRIRSFAAKDAQLRPILLAALMLSGLSGCNRFQHITHEFVYVSARQVYLHDRVAAVSNRVALVTNGEALEVVEHGKRFVKVRTPKGEVGWLEEHAVIDDKLYAQFVDLEKKHAQDPVVANGELRDDLYLHVLPGRETPHFLLEPGNSKVQMLARGTVEKAPPPGTLPVAKPKTLAVTPANAAKPAGNQLETQKLAAQGPVAPIAPPAMEDWWLVRDSAGHTGWLLANRVDVDVPDEVGQYAEGQRMIAAYPIAKVLDDGTGDEHKHKKKGEEAKSAKSAEDADAPAPAAPREETEYVTVLAPPKNGLPYDFDQVRVFTWSLNHHRYETGYRLHGIQGYLPVKIGQETDKGVTYPTFSFEIANGPNVAIDPDNGITRPVNPRTLVFRLEGNLVRRTGADQAPIILTHDPEEAEKGKAAAKKKRR
jgi:SH3-like domain-containing protein